MSRTLRSFRSTATGRARVISTEPGPSSSYPVARIFSEYEPDPSFDEGKAKRPRSSLTTLTVTVEPAFFALTTTPSIAPSSAELTRPVRAVEAWAAAGAGPPPTKASARTAVANSCLFTDDSLVDSLRPAPHFSPIRLELRLSTSLTEPTMIDLYAAGTSNGMRARIGLEECGLAYNLHPIDLTKGEQKSPSFLAMNPNGQIPVIVDSEGPGGKPVTLSQSVAVLMYCAEKSGKFLPKDPAARPAFWQALASAASDMSGMVTAIFTLSRAKDQHGPAIDTFKSMWKSYMKVWDEKLGKQRYAAGGEVTIADFGVALLAELFVPNFHVALPHRLECVDRRSVLILGA